MQRTQALAFVFSNPTLVNLVNRHGIEVVQLLAPTPNGGDEIRLFQQRQVLGDRLAGHVEVFAQFTQGLSIFFAKLVK